MASHHTKSGLEEWHELRSRINEISKINPTVIAKLSSRVRSADRSSHQIPDFINQDILYNEVNSLRENASTASSSPHMVVESVAAKLDHGQNVVDTIIPQSSSLGNLSTGSKSSCSATSQRTAFLKYKQDPSTTEQYSTQDVLLTHVPKSRPRNKHLRGQKRYPPT